MPTSHHDPKKSVEKDPQNKAGPAKSPGRAAKASPSHDTRHEIPEDRAAWEGMTAKPPQTAHKRRADQTPEARDDEDSDVEGEGSYSGSRQYDKGATEFADSGRVQGAARKAKQALEGPEGDALRRAEADAKKGKPS